VAYTALVDSDAHEFTEFLLRRFHKHGKGVYGPPPPVQVGEETSEVVSKTAGTTAVAGGGGGSGEISAPGGGAIDLGNRATLFVDDLHVAGPIEEGESR